MTDDRLEVAVTTVALHVIAQLVTWDAGEQRENYPEIGEHDWNRVEEAMKNLAPAPDLEQYRAAYEYLEARADAE